MKNVLFSILILFIFQNSFGQQKLEKPINNCKNSKSETNNKCESQYKRDLEDYNKELERLTNIYTKSYNNLLSLQQKQELLFTPYVKKAVSVIQSINDLGEFKRQRKTYYDILTNVMRIAPKSENDWAQGHTAAINIGRDTRYVDDLYNLITQRQELANNIRRELSVISFNEESSQNKKSYTKQIQKKNTSNYTNNKESIYDKRRREAENKRKNEAKRFLDNEKKQEEAFQQQMKNIKSNINSMISSWAKERDFRNKISSLSSINSVDASGIIKEARSKITEINNLYSKRKSDAIKQVDNVYKTNTSNNKQNIVNAGFNVLGKIVSQSSLEKERKKKIEELKFEKQRKLNEIANKIKAKFLPVANSYLQKAKYTINENEENYYLGLFEYNKCMVDNALSVVLERENCSKPQTKTFIRKNDYSGKQYYDTYLRKKGKSHFSEKANYFLELAIEKEPNNGEWLYERYSNKNVDLVDKITILERLIQLKPNDISFVSELKSVRRRAVLSKEISIKLAKKFVKSRPEYDWKKHDNLMRYYENGKTFFINIDGEVEIISKLEHGFKYKYRNEYNQYEYDLGEDEFSNGLLKVSSKSDTKLQPVNNKISKSNMFLQGLITSNQSESKMVRWGFMDKEGKIVIPYNYSSAENFSEGLAAVKDNQTGKWGYINKDGKEILNFQYGSGSNFSNGLACVLIIKKEKKGKFYGEKVYINKKGKIIIEGNFDSGGAFINDLAIITKYGKGSFMGGGNTKSYYINKNGKRLNKYNYTTAYPYSKSGFALVKKGNKWAIVDKKGNSKNGIMFWDKPQFSNGIAKVNIGSLTKRKYVYIDSTGSIIKK